MKHDNHLLEQSLPQLFGSHPDGIGVVNACGYLLYGNDKLLSMFGLAQEELAHTTLDKLLNSSRRPVRLTTIPLGAGEQPSGSLVRLEDLTEQRNPSKEISNVLEMFAFISEKSENIISSISAEGLFTYISPSVKPLLGYEQHEVIGQPALLFNHPDTNKKLQEHRSALFIDQNTMRFTGQVRHKEGYYRWYETAIEYIRDEAGQIVQTIGVGRDITERMEAEETIRHQALHDSLTDLPNRRLFKQRTIELLEQLDSGQQLGLMLMDLDGFKGVNDTYGHDVGDLLLMETASRLKTVVGHQDVVARWGGDEFTILQAGIRSRSEAKALMRKLQEAIAQPYFIGGHTLHVTGSIGIAVTPEDGSTLDQLVKIADNEMYRAKKQAKANDKNRERD
ncbi:sensor domain-containing diguanylate cyclase [Paenibacillus sp. PL2-23]|uniref:sensor domain-containing diguanylate cyclase n=1 Tax=Paenibacillus sp. PL2-23 TaxID=2100729 RepID=UPI0030F80735